jgi:hypothetical protein
MGVSGQRHALAALPPGKTRYPLSRRLGWPQGRTGRVRKISPPPGFDPRTVQPVASRYTDCGLHIIYAAQYVTSFTAPTFNTQSLRHIFVDISCTKIDPNRLQNVQNMYNFTHFLKYNSACTVAIFTKLSIAQEQYVHIALPKFYPTRSRYVASTGRPSFTP